jgi:beta-xylosidase
MNAAGTQTVEAGKLVFDGHETDPTVEGPKFYKRNGFYYIFAPAGGVSTGWQLALRSKNVYGPYERKVVMDQGTSPINGPHQGAWVTTQTGEDWFLHFQDKDAYGRVVHLQPMKWVNNWPVIGEDKDGDGKGQPVLTYKKPNVGKTYPIQAPAESDEFNSNNLGLQWQWMANPKATWLFANPANGALRLYSHRVDSLANLWYAPHVLQQKFPAETFMVTTRLTFTPNTKLENEKAGLAIMGMAYANIALKSKKDGIYLVHTVCHEADKSKPETETLITKAANTIYLRLQVKAGAQCQFSYSIDGVSFTNVGEVFTARPGKWIGAKFGIFCTRQTQTNDAGFADFDWLRVEALPK